MNARNIQARQLLDAMAYLEDSLIEEAAPGEQSALTDVKPAGFLKRRKNVRKMTACAAILLTAIASLWVWKGGIATQERHTLDRGQNAGSADLSAPAEFTEEFVTETDSLMIENKNAAGLDAQEPAGAAVSSMITGGAVLEADTAAAQQEDAAAESKDDAIVRLIEDFPPKYEQKAEKCYKLPQKGSYILFDGLKAAIDYWDNANNTIELAEPESYLYHVVIDVFGDVGQNGGTVYEELRFSDTGKELLYQEYERLFMKGICVSLSEDFQMTGTLSREEIEEFEPFADYGYTFRLVNE